MAYIVQDDDQAINSERLKSIKLLGTMEISLYRIIKLLPCRSKGKWQKNELHERSTISEKALKGDARSMQTV